MNLFFSFLLKRNSIILLFILFIFPYTFTNETNSTSEFSNITIIFHSTYHTNVILTISYINLSIGLNSIAKTNNFWYFHLLIPKDTDPRKLTYSFYADGMYYIDPFSSFAFINNGYVYPDLPLNEVVKKSKEKKYVFVSEHFEYYSRSNFDRTEELETYYNFLTNILSLLKPQIQKPKIRYYTHYFKGNTSSALWCFYNRSEIFDSWDCASTHMIIKLLLEISNRTFNNGLAQCFQKEGNYNYKEQNVNLVSRNYIMNKYKNPEDCQIITILMKSHNNPLISEHSHLAGSFIYYHWFILNEKEKMAEFLKSLEYEDTLDSIDKKYQNLFSKNISEVEKEWALWLTSTTPNSNWYINWKISDK